MEIIILLVVAVIGAYFFITTSMKKAEKADSSAHVPSELGKPADEHVEATAPVAPNQTRVNEITELYKTVLGRDPDEEGLKYWVETKATIEEIKVSMMQSEEYIAKITPAEEPKPAKRSRSKKK